MNLFDRGSKAEHVSEPKEEPKEIIETKSFDGDLIVVENEKTIMNIPKVFKFLEKEILDDSIITENFKVSMFGSQKLQIKKRRELFCYVYPKALQVFNRNYLCALMKSKTLKDFFGDLYSRKKIFITGASEAFIKHNFGWEIEGNGNHDAQ